MISKSAIGPHDILIFCAYVQRRLSGHALFAVYVAAIGATIDTNNSVLPEKVLLWFVLPCFVADLLVTAKFSSPPTNPLKTLAGSLILWAAAFYVGFMVLSTIVSSGLLPTEGRRIRTYIIWGSELLLFLTVATHLAATYASFFKRFLFAMSALLTINVAVNLFGFAKLLPHISLANILAERLEPMFGTPDFRNSTHAAPLWSVYVMAMLGLLATCRLARIQIWLIALSVPMLLVGIVLTQSRAAVFAIFLVTIAIAFAAKWRWRLAVFLCLVVIILGFWAVPSVRDTLLARGTSFRPELWIAYLNLSFQHPWLGYGLDRLVDVHIDNLSFQQPHNALIWAQVRGGILGAAFATIMLGGSLLATFRWWRSTSDVSLLAAVAVLSIIGMTEIGFLIYPFSWLWVVFWLPIGLGAGAEIAYRTRAIGLTVEQPRWPFPGLSPKR